LRIRSAALRAAQTAPVVEVLANDDDRSAAGRRVADVAAWLGHHQVEAYHMVPSHRGEGVEQLLHHASDIEADIIVAGAYGHTRMREWIFGGVTQDLITNSNRCSFISH
jgi:nucleotide-binding universal stress UspA family protein